MTINFSSECIRLNLNQKVLTWIRRYGSLDALKKLREGKEYDILLFDIIMPVMDGIELLRTVAKENLAMKSVIIMLTNETQSSQIVQAEDCTADGYIVKASSIPSEVLEEVIRIHTTKNKK